MSKGTQLRNIRVGALWDEAQATAARRGENLSAKIREFLAAYVAEEKEDVTTSPPSPE